MTAATRAFLRGSFAALCLGFFCCAASLPTAAAATGDADTAGAYEQALSNFDAGEYSEAIIRLKNLLQADPDSIAARLLLGRAYLRSGHGAGAEAAFKHVRSRGAADPHVLALLAEALMMQGKFADVIEQIPIEGQNSEIEGRLLVQRGYAHLELGNDQAAEASFAEAAQRLPGDPAPLLGQVRLAVALGEFAAAAVLAEEAAAAHPDSADAWYFKGDVRRVRGDLEGAAADYGKALSIEPAHLGARLARAAIFIDRGRDDEALADLDAIETTSPGDLQSAYLRALVLARRNEPEAAQAILQEAWDKVSRWERAALRNHGPGLLFAATLSYRQGDLDQAKTHLERFLELDPYHIEARKLLGSILLQEGEAEAALFVLRPALDLTEQDAELFSLIGQGYARAQRYAEATEMFGKAVSLAPEDSPMRARLALSRFAAGDTATAVATLEPALAAGAHAAMPSTLLAFLHLNDHAYAEALAAASAVTAQDPSNPIALNLAGLAQLGLGDEQAARQSYQAALAASPDFWPARLNLGRLDRKAGDRRAAEAHFREILEHDRNQLDAMLELANLAVVEGDYMAAADWLEQVGKIAPDAVDPLMLLVDVYMAMGKPEEALAVAWNVEVKDPGSPVIAYARGRVALAKSEARDARKHLQRAATQFGDSPAHLVRLAGLQNAAGDLVGARESLRRAVELAPTYLPALTALATLELEAGHADRAMEIAERLRQDYPNSPAGEMLAGDLALRAGDPAAATAAYSEAIEKQPSSALIVRLHQARLADGDGRGALAVLQQWLAAHPNDATVRRALATALIVSGRFQDAVVEHERLLEHAPEDVGLLNNLAWLYSQLGDDRARRHAEQAYALSPNDPGVLDTLGWILVREGEPERGLTLLREAQARGVQAQTVGYHIAVALAKQGRREDALQELERALAGGDTFMGAADAKALLQQLSAAQ